ncbi:calcium/sodium antiporter [Dasania sp. GY-MA-18]|uniref:Calcium/sodium antiporter n=1 Tax=Dasania phycosphaerae TaxID=2950436 RepID=A0A9J6RIF2_9GAMM|nr:MULTISPECIES: calcium/sodium antiporter [Dasania]MCR8921563.1 calcium/sodium antiporter [Dasania sp. GY-MA-18]MCZ0863991.1 calcium/sodium antiporter [Dasania phycosphaerae]MCZ0867719.1 calcium/sodium antiporter [Dasania phycosphaerae]
MLEASIAIIIGFAGLIWSADQFVAGAAAIAKNLGMAPIMIGLTIVAFGTSAPEIIVSISAALKDAGGLAVGNALGSNLANIGMVLGITALVAPIPIALNILKREMPLLLIATLGASYCLYDLHLSWQDGVILLVTLAVIFYILVTSKSHQPDAEHEADVEHIPTMSSGKAWLLFAVGFALLIASSQLLVWGAKIVAIELGVSELIIGLTIVAVGTSLPELAATVASALKGHHDIALGNIIGSNLFNLLAVMAMPALISPTALSPEVFSRDYMSMAGITVLLAAILYGHYLWAKRSNAKLSSSNGTPALLPTQYLGRLAGAALLICYVAYYYLLFPIHG